MLLFRRWILLFILDWALGCLSNLCDCPICLLFFFMAPSSCRCAKPVLMCFNVGFSCLLDVCHSASFSISFRANSRVYSFRFVVPVGGDEFKSPLCCRFGLKLRSKDFCVCVWKCLVLFIFYFFHWCFFFWYIYLLCYYSYPTSAPSLNSLLPTPSLPHSPPIVHVHGSYL